MTFTSNKTLYYVLRAGLVLLGAYLVSLSLFSLLLPDVLYSEAGRSSWPNRLDAALMLYGLLLIVPHRWLNQPLVFPFALLVFALGIVWAAYVSISGLIGLVRGQQSWFSLPALIIFLLLALLAPVALMMHRRLNTKKRETLP